ncbi:CRISPR-associated protein Cas4 [Sporanaerobium hydrogeniformans]|uniref:CRISPR-associated protein Cas4 n=1 Tax=Sporanaerobium hydrogeniformans TaxID=3072179 RepID=A0AC61DFD4_9FIRM|nr:CRISPR-associated protein Cas4 [Sporanaerobium hydrogeniformans]PHV71543.1 CRISPR-associated protein Cas4 [Sporanaerobium hydrogeniformans]
MLSGIQHFCFCPRQWGLIHIEQQWEDNTRTFGGTVMHEKADDPFFTESRGTLIVSRSMPLVSHQLKLKGIADVVEFHKQEDEVDHGIILKGRQGKWRIEPVEYKYGQPKENNSDLVQLCAQAICLEEMFKISIHKGSIYYGKIRHRVEVIIDTTLREEVKNLVETMYHYYTKEKTPLGKYEPRCKNCSLYNLCVPNLSDKVKSLKKYIDTAIKC